MAVPELLKQRVIEKENLGKLVAEGQGALLETNRKLVKVITLKKQHITIGITWSAGGGVICAPVTLPIGACPII